MPIIQTYQTDLKSLRYGQDRPGGGSSNQPYHKVNYRKKFELGTGGLAQTGGSDLILRGGYLTTGIPGYANSRILADTERIGKWLASPEGLVWIGQQNVLSQLGTRIYGGYPLSVQLPNTRRLNGGTYTPLSTLAAVVGNAFGGHPNKQGIDFRGQNPELSLPQYVNLVNLPNEFDGIKNLSRNRLVNLYRTKIADYQGAQSTELYSYKGGPQSDKGLQLTTVINAAKDRTIFKSSNVLATGTDTFPLSYITWDQSDFNRLNYNSSRTYFVVGNGTTTTVQDFRKALILNGTQSNISSSPNYKTQNIELRVKLGDPGKRGVNRGNYTRGRSDLPIGLDTINSLYLYKSNAVTTDSRKNDLVKFRIAVINNDNPKQKTFAHFRAFINSFSDSSTASWDSFKYLGRGEDFYNYNGFSRTCNMSFTLMAQSIQELSIMYQKLNYIISSLSPDYGRNGYMRGNLVQFTLGGYFYETPGILKNINVTIPNDTTWEVGIPASSAQDTRAVGSNGFTDSNVKELPHRLDIDLEFAPIYDFLPQIVGSSYTVNAPSGSASSNPKGILGAGQIKQRFISLQDADGNINNLYNDGVAPVFYPGPKNVTDPNILPSLANEINEIPLIDFPTDPEEDLVPLIPGTLRFNRQIARPGLGINELSDEELSNLGN
jgi:hypothetical protein